MRFFKKNNDSDVDIIPNVEEKIVELFESLNYENIELVLGNDFIEFKDTVLNEIIHFRELKKDCTGFIFPPIHVLSSEDLQENEFVLKVQDKDIVNDFVIPNEENIKEEINKALEYVYENYLEDIFTNELAEKYINTVQSKQPWIIWNLTCMYSVVEVKEVLIKILQSKKSLRNINLIFEKFAHCTLESGFCCHYSAEKIANKIIKSI